MKFNDQNYYVACIEPNLFLGVSTTGHAFLTNNLMDATISTNKMNIKAAINMASNYVNYNWKIHVISFDAKKITEVKD